MMNLMDVLKSVQYIGAEYYLIDEKDSTLGCQAIEYDEADTLSVSLIDVFNEAKDYCIKAGHIKKNGRSVIEGVTILHDGEKIRFFADIKLEDTTSTFFPVKLEFLLKSGLN